MMMPPKKSMAARQSNSANKKDAGACGTDGVNNSETVPTNENETYDDDVHSDFFEPVVIDGKRKRCTPQAEKTLRDWLVKHFVEKEDAFLSPGDMHAAYLESCASESAFGVEMSFFLKVMSEMYPKGMGLVESSPYVDIIRKRKPKKDRSSKSSKSNEHKPKFTYIIKEAIMELGNPREGLTFYTIRKYVSAHNPDLHIDERPNLFKRALMREADYSRVECVTGVGALGRYRLPRTKEEERIEIAEERRIKKENAEKKVKGGSETTKEGINTPEKKDSNDTEVADGEIEHANTGAVDANKDVKTTGKKRKLKANKKLQKRNKIRFYCGQPKVIEDVFSLALTYNNEPKRASFRKIISYLEQHYCVANVMKNVEKCMLSGLSKGYWQQVTGNAVSNATFNLELDEVDPTADDDFIGQISNAIVACAEPKVSSSHLLKQYIMNYHPEFRIAEKPFYFKRALERAIAKKLIVRLSGIGASGSFKLAVPFTPSPAMLQGKDMADDSEDESEDRSSVSSYAYNPRPTKRCGGRKMAARIEQFNPCAPDLNKNILVKGFKKELTQSSNVKTSQRKTQVARMRGRPKSSAKLPNSSRKLQKTNDGDSDSDEKSENSEEYTPRKSSSRGGNIQKQKVVGSAVNYAVSRKRGRPKSSAKLPNCSVKLQKTNDSDSESDEKSENSEEYIPRKSSSRGGNIQMPKVIGIAVNSAVSRKRGRPKSSAKLPNSSEKLQKTNEGDSDSDEKSENNEEYTPRKSSSRGGNIQTPKVIGTAVTSAVSRKRGRPKSSAKLPNSSEKLQKTNEGDSDSDEKSENSEEYIPRKSSSRGGNIQTPKVIGIAVNSAVSRKRGRPKSSAKLPNSSEKLQKTNEGDSDSDEKSENNEEYIPRKSSSRGGNIQMPKVIGIAVNSAVSRKRGRPKSSAKLPNSSEKLQKTNEGDSDSDEKSENNEEYTPRKSSSRGGNIQTPKVIGIAVTSAVSRKRGRPKSSAKLPNSSEKLVKTNDGDSDSDEKSENNEEYTPRKSSSRGGNIQMPKVIGIAVNSAVSRKRGRPKSSAKLPNSSEKLQKTNEGDSDSDEKSENSEECTTRKYSSSGGNIQKPKVVGSAVNSAVSRKRGRPKSS